MKFKKLILFFFLSYFNVTIFSSPVIMWDLHNTLFKRNHSLALKKFVSILYHSPHPIRLLFRVPFILKDAYHIAQVSETTDIFIEELIKHFPELKMQQNQLLELVNAYTPIKDTTDLVLALHKEGYDQMVASNIGEKSLKFMQKKYPHIFACFSAYSIPYYDLKEHKVVSKPEMGYFENTCSIIHKIYKNVSVILFIDDQKNNIEAFNNHCCNITSECWKALLYNHQSNFDQIVHNALANNNNYR